MFCYMSWLRFLPRHWKPTNFYFWSSGRSKVLVGLLASRFNMKTLEDWENCLERASSVYECLSKVVCSLTPRIHDETFELRGCTWCLLHQSLMYIDGVYQDLPVSTVISSTQLRDACGRPYPKMWRISLPDAELTPIALCLGFSGLTPMTSKIVLEFLGFHFMFVHCLFTSFTLFTVVFVFNPIFR